MERRVSFPQPSQGLPADDHELYEALRRVHLLDDGVGNVFADLDTFVASGESMLKGAADHKAGRTLVRDSDNCYAWLEHS